VSIHLLVRGPSAGPVDWSPPVRQRPRAIVSLTFDCGVLPDGTQLKLEPEELEDSASLPADEAATCLPANVAPRVAAALEARRDSSAVSLTDAAKPAIGG
jgi:8-oxo-dGTP diphosphatase